MALECFDRGGSLDHTARLAEEQKEKARWLVAVAMTERGESPEDITDVFDMLGIWPSDHIRGAAQ